MIKYERINPEGYKYRLTEPAIFQTGMKGLEVECPFVKLYKNGAMRLNTGFGWDGSSSISIDTESNMDAACGHDGGYRLLQYDVIPKKYRAKFRRKLDKMMRKLYKQYINHHQENVVEKTGNFVRRWYTWAGVRLFGGFAAQPKNLLED
jgi:hypothetical protein